MISQTFSHRQYSESKYYTSQLLMKYGVINQVRDKIAYLDNIKSSLT